MKCLLFKKPLPSKYETVCFLSEQVAFSQYAKFLGKCLNTKNQLDVWPMYAMCVAIDIFIAKTRCDEGHLGSGHLIFLEGEGGEELVNKVCF